MIHDLLAIRPLKIINGPNAGLVGIVMRVSAKGDRITLAVGDDSTPWQHVVCKADELELLDRVDPRGSAGPKP